MHQGTGEGRGVGLEATGGIALAPPHAVRKQTASVRAFEPSIIASRSSMLTVLMSVWLPNGSRLSCGASAARRKRPVLRYVPAGAQTYASSESRPRQLQALVRRLASIKQVPEVYRRDMPVVDPYAYHVEVLVGVLVVRSVCVGARRLTVELLHACDRVADA